MLNCLVGVVCILATIAVASAQAQFDYCQQSKKSTYIFVDVTTRYDDLDKKSVLSGLAAIFESLQVGEKVSIYDIRDSAAKSERLLKACKPGCLSSSSVLGGLKEWAVGGCSELLSRQDVTDFNRTVLATAKNILESAKELPASDIVRTLSVDLRAEKLDPSARIFIYSDLLENSALEKYSRVKYFKSPMEVLARAKSNNLVLSLNGASIRVFGFGRSHNLLREDIDLALESRLRTFWEAYFREGGAGDIIIGKDF
jgi:hypothetical protein